MLDTAGAESARAPLCKQRHSLAFISSAWTYVVGVVGYRVRGKSVVCHVYHPGLRVKRARVQPYHRNCLVQPFLPPDEVRQQELVPLNPVRGGEDLSKRLLHMRCPQGMRDVLEYDGEVKVCGGVTSVASSEYSLKGIEGGEVEGWRGGEVETSVRTGGEEGAAIWLLSLESAHALPPGLAFGVRGADVATTTREHRPDLSAREGHAKGAYS